MKDILRDAATTHHASLCTRGTRQTVAVLPLEMASEMGILLWEDDCGVLSGSTPPESERRRAGQREELNCNTVITKASLEPTERDGTGMALQRYLKRRQGPAWPWKPVSLDVGWI